MRHTPRKRFGQNFLQDRAYQEKIAAAINVKPGARLLEIGPGQGAITQHLIAKHSKLTAVELDRDLIAALRERYSADQLKIVESDVLKVDLSAQFPGERLSVIGNLPYNISTPLIFHLLGHIEHIDDMVFMLQKEVVDRLCAQPGSKTYGRLTVMAALDVVPEKLFNVPPGAFYPAPKVMSTVVRLRPRESMGLARLAVDNRERLGQIVAAAFGQRRKTLKNALSGLVDESGFSAAEVDAGARAEELKTDNFIYLANHINPSSNT